MENLVNECYIRDVFRLTRENQWLILEPQPMQRLCKKTLGMRIIRQMYSDIPICNHFGYKL